MFSISLNITSSLQNSFFIFCADNEFQEINIFNCDLVFHQDNLPNKSIKRASGHFGFKIVSQDGINYEINHNADDFFTRFKFDKDISKSRDVNFIEAQCDYKYHKIDNKTYVGVPLIPFFQNLQRKIKTLSIFLISNKIMLI